MNYNLTNLTNTIGGDWVWYVWLWVGNVTDNHKTIHQTKSFNKKGEYDDIIDARILVVMRKGIACQEIVAMMLKKCVFNLPDWSVINEIDVS